MTRSTSTPPAPAWRDSPDWKSLVRAVCLDPADDTPRLVAADWLADTSRMVDCEACNGTGREVWECKVCGARPDGEGEVVHGRGCYVLDSDGGGSEYPDLSPCPHCSGSGRASDGRAERAELIRGQIADTIAAARFRVNDRGGGDGNSLWWECVPAEESPDRWPGDSARGDNRLWSDIMRDALGPPWWPKDDDTWITFRRGFVSVISLPLAPFLDRAGELGGACPLERVGIVDRMPDPDAVTLESGSWWLDEDGDPNPEDLPPEVFALLPSFAVADSGRWRKTYVSTAEAQLALSRACIRLARRRAGLDGT